MRFIILLIIFISSISVKLYSQVQTPPQFYAHKITVVEILQTKNYTYLHAKEHIGNSDSMQWLALPLFEPKIGDVYYFQSGLQMGDFHSNELNRNFNGILFLGGLSTSPEISEKTIVPSSHLSFEDTIPKNEIPVQSHTVIVKEVLQTSGYTYLRVKEDGKEEWLAVNKIPAKAGQTYTYSDAALMTDFRSKELDRTFKEILFIGKLNLKEEPGKNKDETIKH